MVVLDINGKFFVVVKEGDVLIFLFVSLEFVKCWIILEDLFLGLFIIKMIVKNIELKELIVNKNIYIIVENFGIILKG